MATDIASRSRSHQSQHCERGQGEFIRAAYLHVPFCHRRCYYCDFPVSVVGDRPLNGARHTLAHYVAVLGQEIEVTPPSGVPLETVFLGGGTPSLLSPQQVGDLLTRLDRRFGLAADAEISMEVDPGTFNTERLRGYGAAGVNRLSLGVQAFQDELLAACGRAHSLADTYAALDCIQRAGFSNLSLDLIFGLPHQSQTQWQASLTEAVRLGPTHLSCYGLTLEPETPFGRQLSPNRPPLPSEDAAAQMYRQAQRTLTAAGYTHYEIANYALPGYQCRHNRQYWENRPFYGLGMGASDRVGGQRLTRPVTRRRYYAWVRQLQRHGWQPSRASAPEADDLLEGLMLGLRLREGIRLRWLRQHCSSPALRRIEPILQHHNQRGWIEALDASGRAVALENGHPLPAQGRLRLSDPEGFLVSNAVLADLFAQLE